MFRELWGTPAKSSSASLALDSDSHLGKRNARISTHLNELFLCSLFILQLNIATQPAGITKAPWSHQRNLRLRP